MLSLFISSLQSFFTLWRDISYTSDYMTRNFEAEWAAAHVIRTRIIASCITVCIKDCVNYYLIVKLYHTVRCKAELQGLCFWCNKSLLSDFNQGFDQLVSNSIFLVYISNLHSPSSRSRTRVYFTFPPTKCTRIWDGNSFPPKIQDSYRMNQDRYSLKLKAVCCKFIISDY